MEATRTHVAPSLPHVPTDTDGVQAVADFVSQLPLTRDYSNRFEEGTIDGIVFLEMSLKELLDIGMSEEDAEHLQRIRGNLKIVRQVLCLRVQNYTFIAGPWPASIRKVGRGGTHIASRQVGNTVGG